MREGMDEVELFSSVPGHELTIRGEGCWDESPHMDIVLTCSCGRFSIRREAVIHVKEEEIPAMAAEDQTLFFAHLRGEDALQ